MNNLFLDIDGVFFGHYAGEWQIRPYATTFIRWAKENGFNIHWLSYNSNVHNISHILESSVETSVLRRSTHKYKNANLSPDYGKLFHIVNTCDVHSHWFMIEDEPPCGKTYEYLKKHKCLHKWIVVPETGSDVLLDVKWTLERWLQTEKVYVPKEWTDLKYDRKTRNLCTITEYKGYPVSDHA